jgi:aspartate/methionine/tyrosine aminotransferase
MKIAPFQLERYFAQYEFTAPYLLCCSDCEALTKAELLAAADAETRQLWEQLGLGYTESSGHPLLRQEIARLYPGLIEDDVLVCAPEEGIFIAMNVLLQPGDRVIVTFPGYQSLYEIASSLGCSVTRWLPREGEGGWNFDVQDLESALQSPTRLLVINFPHNPTGALISAAQFTRILDLARQHECCVFSDEMYRFLEYDPAQRLPAAASVYDRALSLAGLSKSFGLPGLRIGWLVTPDKDLLARLAAFKDYTTICSSAPSEILAIMALRARDKLWQRSLEIVHRNLDRLDRFFTTYARFFSWSRPTAGCIGFPRLLAGLKAADFCADLLEQRGVLLLPSNLYDYPAEYFRIGYGRRHMPQALAQLEAYLKPHSPQNNRLKESEYRNNGKM